MFALVAKDDEGDAFQFTGMILELLQAPLSVCIRVHPWLMPLSWLDVFLFSGPSKTAGETDRRIGQQSLEPFHEDLTLPGGVFL